MDGKYYTLLANFCMHSNPDQVNLHQNHHSKDHWNAVALHSHHLNLVVEIKGKT